MGRVFHGIDPELALSLARKFELRTFVETGTLTGKTSLWASRFFERVLTVEVSAHWYDIAFENFKGVSNIELIYGDSVEFLSEIVPTLEGNALFWLDAHWSRDLGYVKPEVTCPVMQEIEVIRETGKPHVIMVDDARLFGVQPGWPTLVELTKALSFNGRNVTVINDIVLSVS